MFKKGEAYLDWKKIPKLIKLLKNAKNVYLKAKKADEIAEEFK